MTSFLGFPAVKVKTSRRHNIPWRFLHSFLPYSNLLDFSLAELAVSCIFNAPVSVVEESLTSWLPVQFCFVSPKLHLEGSDKREEGGKLKVHALINVFYCWFGCLFEKKRISVSAHSRQNIRRWSLFLLIRRLYSNGAANPSFLLITHHYHVKIIVPYWRNRTSYRSKTSNWCQGYGSDASLSDKVGFS